MDPRARNTLIVVAALVAAWYVYGWWTYPPAVEFDNLKYVQQLSSAVSSRDDVWLGKIEAVVLKRHTEGTLSAQELDHFSTIIATARTGDWSQADRDCFAFAEAQLSRRRSRPPSDDHAGHKH